MKQKENHIFFLFALLFFFTLNVALPQEYAKDNMLQIHVDESIDQPMIFIGHPMGGINVYGEDGEKLIIYAEQLLPSVSDLRGQNKHPEIIKFINRQSKEEITIRRNSQFSVRQIEHVFEIETNLFSMNSNLYVVAPKRSSISVNSNEMGNVHIENVSGDVEINANSGNIMLKDIDGAISASTIYGNIITHLEKKSHKKPIFISTFIGNIEVIIPKNSKNTILLSSEQGNLFSNFDTVNTINIASQYNYSKNRRLKFNLNGGGTEFVLNTFKGDIYLRYHE